MDITQIAIDSLAEQLLRLERKVRNLEFEVEEVKRMARNAQDDSRRVEDRLRYLEEAR